MAFKMPIKKGNIKAEYWRIDGLMVLKNSCHVVVGLYTDAKVAKNGTPVLVRNFTVAADVVTKTSLVEKKDPYKLLYPVLKELPEFAKAEDA